MGINSEVGSSRHSLGVLGALKLLVQGFFFFLFSLTNATLWGPENAGLPSFILNVDAGHLLPSSFLHTLSIVLFS